MAKHIHIHLHRAATRDRKAKDAGGPSMVPSIEKALRGCEERLRSAKSKKGKELFKSALWDYKEALAMAHEDLDYDKFMRQAMSKTSRGVMAEQDYRVKGGDRARAGDIDLKGRGELTGTIVLKDGKTWYRKPNEKILYGPFNSVSEAKADASKRGVKIGDAKDEHIGWNAMVKKLEKEGNSKKSAEKIAGAINAKKNGDTKDGDIPTTVRTADSRWNAIVECDNSGTTCTAEFYSGDRPMPRLNFTERNTNHSEMVRKVQTMLRRMKPTGDAGKKGWISSWKVTYQGKLIAKGSIDEPEENQSAARSQAREDAIENMQAFLDEDKWGKAKIQIDVKSVNIKS